MEIKMTTTDTPRTDAVTLVKCYCPRCIVGFHNDLQLVAQYRKHAEWRERAEKAEAEVERLKELVNESIIEKSNLSIALVNCQANLRRAIDVARMLPVIPIPAISSRDITDTLYAELNQLKATLNPTNK